MSPGAAAPGLPSAPGERTLSPFGRFMRTEASAGVVLIVCTGVALLAANSAWAGGWNALWDTALVPARAGAAAPHSLREWINDGLMALFFFSVGLEIKRELWVGELASARRAALPVAGALGGMLLPALIYAALNRGGAGAAGWGIPMATDIAFSLGVLALLGTRAPVGLRVFLAALAIADDLGAVLVIALFYSAALHLPALLAGLALVAALTLLGRLGAQRPWVFALLGVAVWLCFLGSGVHATVAGVLVAFTVPARAGVRDGTKAVLDTGDADAEVAVSAAARPSTLQRMEQALHPWVSFAVIPLFALANAGISLRGGSAHSLLGPVALGVVLGLTLGKPLGITLFAWLASRLGLAALPEGCDWRSLHAVSWLAGIGFTMSIFITGLAFDDPARIIQAKLGIFTASCLAALLGWLQLSRLPRRAAG